MNDIRFAFRTLLRTPGFSLAAVLTLGMGIGLNTAMFSLVNPILFRPLPFREPDRLVYLNQINPAQGFTKESTLSVSYADYRDWRRHNQVFEDVGVYRAAAWTMTGSEESDRIRGSYISATLFTLLGTPAMLGRTFPEGEDDPNAAPAVLLGYGLWQRLYGAETNVVGQALALDGRSYTIAGVMPVGFRFPYDSELWMPLVVERPEGQRGSFSLEGVARLRPGVTFEQAEADMARISRQLAEAYPKENSGVTALVRPLRLEMVEDMALMSWVLMGAVGFVLAVACANVANLFLARALGRQREWAVRSALGASRWRLLRPLLTEGLWLALVAGGLGLILSQLGVKAALAAIPVEIPYWIDFGIDHRVLGFTLGATLLSCALFGLAPAWQASGTDPHDHLKAGSRGAGEGQRRNRLRRLLVASEVGLALLLMSGTGLMVQTTLNLHRANPGFRAESLLTFYVDLWAPEYHGADPTPRIAFFREFLAGLRRLPGVAAVSAVSNLPMAGSNWGMLFTLEGKPPPRAGETPIGNTRVTTPGYFEAMGIPLLRGRDFTEADQPESPKVVIIDATMARQFFADADPIGRRLKLGKFDSANAWCEIVGVAGEVRHYGLDQPVRAGFYFPHKQFPRSGMTVVVRTERADAMTLLPAARRALTRLDGRIVAAAPWVMEDLVRRSFWQKRFFSQLFGVFALLALVLASVGVAAVVGYSVSQRTHELGVRMALGAERGDVLRLVIRDGLRPVVEGLLAGLAGSWLMLRVLQSEMYGVSTSDPRLYLGLSVVLGLVALAAAYMPARRASRLEPVAALRCE